MFLKKSVAGAASALGLLERARKNARPPWRVLMYHRIINPETESYPLEAGMYVRPATFRMHLEYLKKSCNVVLLDDLIASIKANTAIAPGTVALTFDDGWKDNYTNAFPLLKEFGLPATVFVATSFVGTTRLFWSDEVCRAMGVAWRRDSTRDQVFNLFRSELGLEISSDLFTALDSAIDRLKVEKHENREGTVAVLRKLVSQTFAEEHRFLSGSEIQEMHRSGIAFGSHSHSHRNLTELSPLELERDLLESKDKFATMEIPCSTCFCYPGGYRNEIVMRAVSGAGFQSVLTTGRAIENTKRLLHVRRHAIHEDVSSTKALFAARLWWDQSY